MTIVRNLLTQKGIQCEEAGGNLAPGQNAFCQKICSKIITSQFCIVLLNHDDENGKLVPNANVNMEYGLMLGFNKYLIPFQQENQTLPFNVAGLDTVKYGKNSFESKASTAIDIAIEKTNQNQPDLTTPDQVIQLQFA
jgi:predicted nucleotide-binding protein